MSTRKTYLGDSVYADYNNDSQQVVLTTNNGQGDSNIIYLEHEVLQALGKFILKLQHELANKIVNTPQVIEGVSEGPLEEVTLESEIDRVTKIIEDAGLFEASSEPESVTLMKIDVEYARQSIVDSDPTKQIRSMGLLARWS